MKEEYKGTWVYAEHNENGFDKTVFELLGRAQELKKTDGGKVTAILPGFDVKSMAKELFEYGADSVIAVESPALKTYSARPYAKALTALAEQYKPSIILFGATDEGRDLAPRMMVSLDTGLTADAIDIGYDDDGEFYQTTPGYGGKILAHIVIRERRPQMATVHPHILPCPEPVSGAQGELITVYPELEAEGDVEIVSESPIVKAGKALNEEAIIIAGGRGIKSEEELAMLKKLAELCGGAVASSRPLVDQGWLEHEKQIGQSGTTVVPDVILNVGISGSVQYQLGMNKAKCIISVNRSEDAPIFDISHYGVVADLKQIIPALIEELEG